MANSLISMIKGDSTLIDNTEVLDGQVLFDTTNQKILLDDESERKEYGGAIKKGEIAYVESAMVTTRGYSAGDYIIVQDTLYKVTTQINSGTALVVGTNVSATTVGSELTQLNNDLSVFSFRNNSGTAQYSMNNGSTWTNFKNPVGTRNIYSNGTYDVTNYASASVNVSLSGTTIWSNSSPTSNFGQKKITIDHGTSEYSRIIIKYAKNNSLSEFIETIGEIAVGKLFGVAFASGDGNWFFRPANVSVVSSTSITVYFAQCGYWGSTTGYSNGHLIPYEVIGLKN